jgi:hypothetical protein
MVATAISITDVNAKAKNHSDQGGQRSTLTVTFKVNYTGYGHIAGLVIATDWTSREEIFARFDHNDGGSEIWIAEKTVQGLDRVFSFVCWCEDYCDNNNVKKVWNNNGGHPSRVTAVW